MKIIKLEIKEFGKLRDLSLELGDEINLILGDNESGKSTILLFIKFMLYGVARKTKSSPVSEAERALSWENDKAGGSMTLTHSGKRYRIERRLPATAKNLQVFDDESGEPLKDITAPGEYFLGMTAEVFESTSAISQLGCTLIKGESVTAATQNLMSNADEAINTDRALRALDEARKSYQHKGGKGGSIYELETKSESLEKDLARAIKDNQEIEELQSKIDDTEKKLDAVLARKKIADELFSKTSLLSVVRLFDDLHSHEKAKSDFETKAAELTAFLQKNGFMPNRNYLAELKGSLEEYELIKRQLAAKRNELADAEKALGIDGELEKKLERISAEGGVDAIRRRLKSEKGKKSMFASLSFITAIASAVAAVFFLPALAGLLLPLLFCILAVSASVSYGKYCRALGSDKGHIDEFLKQVTEELAALERSRQALGALTAELSTREMLFLNASQRLISLLSRYKTVSTDPESEAKGAVAEIEKALDELDRMQNLIAAQDTMISRLSATLAEYNEHKVRGRLSLEILSMSEEQIKRAKLDRDLCESQAAAYEGSLRRNERLLIEKRSVSQNPFKIAEELEAVNEELARQRERLAAVLLAVEAIGTAAENLQNTVTPKLRAMSNEYIGELTDDKYSSVSIDASLGISIAADGFSHPLEAFSTGTRNAAYIALRLSLSKLLSPDAPPPLFMDETLAMIDDKRATAILAILAKYCGEGGQCLLFSCHDRERMLCEKKSIPYKLISL